MTNSVLGGLCLLGWLLLTACESQQKEDNDKLVILATTGMIGDAVKNIVGDSADVEVLMGPGTDPHLYKMSQGDLHKLTKADIIIYNGLYLEGKMGEVLQSMEKQKPVTAFVNGIAQEKLRNVSGFAGGYDPHVWFSIELWKDGVAYVSRKIIEADPARASFYQANTQAYIDSLNQLEEWVRAEISRIPESQRVLITAHDAFGYFGDAYGITVEGLQGISTVSEPGLKDIIRITDLIVERKIKSIFVETSVSEKTVRSVLEGAAAKGQKVTIGGTLYSDALGDETSDADTYIGMVRENVRTIVRALED